MEHLVAGNPPTPSGLRPFTRSEEAAQRLVRFVERGPSIEEAEDEARAIVADWLRIATRDGVRPQVHGAICMLRSALMDITAETANHAREQDGKDPAEARRLRRMCDALEAAVDALGDESRRLKSERHRAVTP